MRKVGFAVLLLFLASGVYAAEASVTSIGVAAPVVISANPTVKPASSDCNISSDSVNSIVRSAKLALGLNNYSFTNITLTNCYDSGSYKNVYVNVELKSNSSDFVSKTLSITAYASSSYDFSKIFTSNESSQLDYTLQANYAKFLENNTDESYFVLISPKMQGDSYDCAGLLQYYNSFSGKKYFGSDNGYCSAAVWTNISQVKSLVSGLVGGISYLGDSVSFTFNGVSKGSFDLSSLAKSMNCTLNTNDYYYPASDLGCYGIYKSQDRGYVSSNMQVGDGWVYVSAYGYLGGKGIVSVSSYGKSVTQSQALSFVKNVTQKYLGTAYTLDLSSKGDSLSGEASISNFSIVKSALNGMNHSSSPTEDNYWNRNDSVSIGKPYIQVYVPQTVQEAKVANSALIPYYWGRSFTVTSSGVYSSITVDSDNESLALEKIMEYVSPYVSADSWNFNMSIGGYYHIMPLATVKAGIGTSIVMAPEVSNTAAGTANSGVRDSFSSQFPDFANLTNQTASTGNSSIISSIMGFLKGLFGG